MRRFVDEDFLTPVEFAEAPKDVELLVSQHMVKVIDKMHPFAEQESFIEKMQTYRTNLMTLKPNDRKLLGQALTRDGVTYLLAILCKLIQENSGRVEAKKERRAARNAQQQPLSVKNENANNLEFAVARSPAAGTKFTFAGSRNSAAAAQYSGAGPSSYEYYEESEEEPDINSITGDAITSVQGGQKVPDKASSVINLQN